MSTNTEILSYLQDMPHTSVRVAACDIDGVLRGKYISKEKAISALEHGFGFCDVVFGWDSADQLYDNAEVTGWHTGYPDTAVQIDPQTWRLIPWEDGKPFLLGDFVNADGSPYAPCPRQLLKRVIAKAESMGFTPFAASEFEFFLFNENAHSLNDKNYTNLQPLTPGMFGYSLLRASARSEFLNELLDAMQKYRCPVEGIHTETGPGVFEAAIQYSTALEAADRAILFKTGVKEMAYRHDMIASFMAKIDASLPGCSGHTHMSLWDNKAKQNLFADANGRHGMSKTFEQFVAGVLVTLPDFMACYAPTINSYKRRVPGVWSPINASWGVENRTTSVRVIPGMYEKQTRMEHRTTGSDVNPYIAQAATLAAGLYGIEKQLELSQAPVQGDAYALDAAASTSLPRNLHEATAALQRSEVAGEILGEDFVDHFVRTRDWEAREYDKAVTDWERKRYMELI